MNSFFKTLFSFLFPERCAFCGNVVGRGETACEKCTPLLPVISGPVCPKCGRQAGFCACGGRTYAYERLVAPFYYEGPVKTGIRRMKFRGKPGGAAGFARYAAGCIRKEYQGISFSCVTSVPMSRSGMRKRGYNQAAEFARGISRLTGIPYRELLIKPYDTKPQHTLKASERWGNVFGAYAVSGKVSGQTVLLADDIATTGATLNECARILRLNGASAVYCTAIACVRKGQRADK